jgi:hypothetical protein
VDFVLPAHSFLHGIAYDASGVIIYNFFPRLLGTDKTGTPNQWGFGCAVETTKYKEVFKNTSKGGRMRLMTAMLMIQRHATTLSEKLRDVMLPKEFKRCAQLWEERKLGCN